MRSAREIRFRLAQQIANVLLALKPPSLPRNARLANLSLPGFLYPEEKDLENLACEALAHRFRLMGTTIDTGPAIEWRRDYVNGRVTGTSYFRFIPYLDFERAGDHKNVWELNRHQHLVLLAQAFLLTGRETYVAEIAGQLQSWWQQNPFLRGINWASALEVAIRALSWLWIDSMIGKELAEPVRRQLWNSLYQHGCYLEHNLSTYFSPNTHLLGEGVALHALGLKFPFTKWRVLGERIVREELQRQVRADGSHFEQSTYYHVYALDFFLLHYELAGRPVSFHEHLRKMARFLTAVNGPAGELSFLGDDDGGRLFHPYGDRSRFGRATLAACDVALGDNSGQPQTTLFPDSGIAAITRGDLHILIDAGPFGPGGAGHSHSDTLSLTIRRGAEEILIDPGTYTYVADPKLRDAFRGSGYHNTILVDGLDQGDAVKPFRWENKPAVKVRHWDASAGRVYLDAECSYRGITHRRRFLLIGTSVLFILDELSGEGGEHFIEQFWHAGEPVTAISATSARIGSAAVFFSAHATAEVEQGWRSRAMGQKETAPVIALRWRAALPQVCATAFLFSGVVSAADLQLTHNGGNTEVRLGDFHGVFEP